MDICKQIVRLAKTGQGGIVLTTVEPEQCIMDLRKSVASNEKIDLYTWGMADGLISKTGVPTSLESETKSANSSLFSTGNAGGGAWKRCNLPDLLDWVLARINKERSKRGETDPKEQTVFTVLIRNADHFVDNKSTNVLVLSQLQQIMAHGSGYGISVILQAAPGFTLPVELAEYCEVVEHELPSEDARREILSFNIPGIEIAPAVLAATAGLSGIKAVQFAAEACDIKNGTIRPDEVFRKKALFLGQSAKLDIWSPQFQAEIKLYPAPQVDDLADATEVVLVEEQRAPYYPEIPEGKVKARIRYMSRTDGSRHSRWLEPMSQEAFDTLYRPNRNEYSFDAVVGLQGVKDILTNAMRPGVPDRARLRHLLLLGVPGVGKSMLQKCSSGQFNMPLTSMQSANLYSKWLGDTDKALYWMLKTVSQIGGIFGIDEFQRFLPQGNNSENGTENRVLGTLLTWLNDQNTNLVLSAANNVSQLPDEVTRSGRVDALIFVGFPSREAKDAAWQLYRTRHELPAEYRNPDDDRWTPADIQSCCRLAEMQGVTLERAARWVIPSYHKNPEQMDALMQWASKAGCICAETGEPFSVEASHSIGTDKGRTIKSATLKSGPTRRRINPDVESN